MNQTILRRNLISAAICIGLSGCGSLETMSDSERTQSEGVAAGAIVGGLLGAVFGDRDSALIGAVVGAGAGYLLGGELAKRKAQYANDEAFFDAEIERTSRLNDEALDYHNKTRKEIASLDKQAKQLSAKYARGEASKKEMKNQQKVMEQRIAQHKEKQKALESEVKINLAIIEQEGKARGAKDPYIARLEKENGQLQQQIEKLHGDSTQLAAIDERLSL